MMFFTGFTRFSSDIQRLNEKEGQHNKLAMLKEMFDLVDEAEKILVDSSKNLDDFGRLLDYTWKLKRQTGKAVSTDSIDELYIKGLKAGALGGKLLGAGGGGFLIFYVQPEYKENVRDFWNRYCRAMIFGMLIPQTFCEFAVFYGIGLGCQKVLCQLCIGRLHKYVREAVLLRRLRFS